MLITAPKCRSRRAPECWRTLSSQARLSLCICYPLRPICMHLRKRTHEIRRQNAFLYSDTHCLTWFAVPVQAVYLPLGLQQARHPREHKDILTPDEGEGRLGSILPHVIYDATCSCCHTDTLSQYHACMVWATMLALHCTGECMRSYTIAASLQMCHSPSGERARRRSRGMNSHLAVLQPF